MSRKQKMLTLEKQISSLFGRKKCFTVGNWSFPIFGFCALIAKKGAQERNE